MLPSIPFIKLYLDLSLSQLSPSLSYLIFLMTWTMILLTLIRFILRILIVQYLKHWCCHLSHSSCINLLAEMPGLQISFGAISQMFLHSFLSARSVAQLVEHLSCKQKPRVQVPDAPTLFEQGGLAHPCTPATWMLRSES